MARPRKASDEQIFAAAYRVMQRLGPAQWTLADIASEAALTAGALVQRFGSKRALLVAIMARFADAGPGMHEALRKRHRSPLAALRPYADQMACLAASKEALAHHLDYLRLDLTDPEMHVHFKRHAEAGRAFFLGMLQDAVAAGQLRGSIDTAVLARLVDANITGSLFTWATYQEGPANTWMRCHLDDFLTPYLARPRRVRRPAQT